MSSAAVQPLLSVVINQTLDMTIILKIILIRNYLHCDVFDFDLEIILKMILPNTGNYGLLQNCFTHRGYV